MRWSILAALIVATLPGAHASAEEPTKRPWSLTAGSAWALLGPAAHPTGGLTIRSVGARTWAISERAFFDAGAEFSLMGPDGGARWVGILAGPTCGVRGLPWRLPVEIGVGVNLDAGRLPVINAWGLPLNYSGVYPGTRLNIRWDPSDRASIELYAKVFYADTYSYVGAGLFTGLSIVAPLPI